jgi:hypothetical protein
MQGGGDGGADAASRAGDKSGLASQIEHVC